MKQRFFWVIILAVMAFTFGKVANAQQCITFSYNLATYTNESTDGTNIYASAEIDGSENMIIAQYCAPYLPQYYHWPQVYNQLSIPGGQTVGGWQYGSHTCPSCYLSETNQQSIAAAPGQEVDFTWKADAVCSGAGTFFGHNGWIGLKISLATYLNTNQPPIGSYYEYKLACPNGTVPTCPSSILTSRQNYKWAEESDVQVTEGGKQPYCLGVSAVAFLSGWPAPFDCR